MDSKKVIMTLILIFLAMTFIGCNKKDKAEEGIGHNDIDYDQPATDEIQTIYSDKVIRWGVPDIYRISDIALSEFNKRLIDLGYDFNLQIVQIDFIDYHNDLKRYENETGPLDIAFSGLDSEEEKGKNLELLTSGYYIPLNSFFDTNHGEDLLNLYDEKLWESVKVDGDIFIIPNGAGEDNGITFAFNKRFVNEEDIKDFTGDLSQLKGHMDKVPFDKDFSHILYDLIEHDLFQFVASDYRDGLLLPWDKSGANNPYQYQEFRDILKMFREYYNSQYINYDFSLISFNHKREDVEEFLETGNFFVYISGDIKQSEINADLIMYEKPANIYKRLNGVGIRSDSENKEDAFQLLVLAYTDEELANLLVYGAEGIDYNLEEGKAYTLEGEVYDAYINQLILGIYEMTYPNKDEEFDISRLVDKKKYYQDKVMESPYLAFAFYDKSYIGMIYEIERKIVNSLDVWKSEDIDEEFNKVNKELDQLGIQELITALNDAIDKYLE